MNRYDVIVAGVGAMGSAASWRLAKQGKKVLGIDQYTLGHNLGSSHGETRLIRKAYFEHPDYVPLLEKSYSLWRELESESGETLFHQTGLVIAGHQQSKVLAGVQTASRKYSIPTEHWERNQIAAKLPGFSIPLGIEGIWEETGGYLEVEKAVCTFGNSAKRLGAQFNWNEKVLSCREIEGGVEVVTTRGRYEADKLLLTLGPWSKSILRDFPLKVHRVPLFWFDAKDMKDFPCYAFDLPEGFYYGFPALDGKIKVALHKPLSEIQSPDGVDRTVSAEEGSQVRAFVRRFLPGLNPEPVDQSLCFYTMTPDENFILDSIPGSNRIYTACGLSGHGFKFSPVIGEVLADLVSQGETELPIQFLRRR